MAIKIIKILAISLVSILLILFLLPFVFKGKIVERVKSEINERLDAEVSFGTFRLSLIRQFPELTFRVNDLRVVGKGDFAGDTLADMGRVTVTLDVLKLIRGDYEVSRVRLDNPVILLKTLPGGQVNWDIVPESDAVDEDVEEAGSDVSLALKRVEIRSGFLVYHDDKYMTYIDAQDINGVLRGDLSMSQTDISTRDATIGSFSLRYDRWPVLSRVAVMLTAEMDADLERLVFVFRDNQIRINELPLVFDGMVGWPADDLEMDFRFGAARSDFASFLSVLPAMYTDDFHDLKSAGSLKLEGHVKGAYTDAEYPGFGLTIEVDDGMFQYPDLPASVEKVQVRASVSNPGKDLDLTVVDVPLFNMELAGAPVEARFLLKTPVSDPDFDVRLAGRLDLAMVEQFYPLDEGYVLRGILESDVEMRGAMSMIEQVNYEAFHADGRLLADNIYVASPLLDDPIIIDVADFRFNPREVSLEAFDMQMGESDLSAKGVLSNLPGYLFDNQLLRGTFTTRSSYFDLNKLMDQMPEETVQEAGEATATQQQTAAGEGSGDDASALSVIRIPANIDFTLESTFDKVLFGKLDMSDVTGLIQVAEEQVHMEQLQLNLLGGSLALNGVYDSRDRRPWVSLGLNILGLDIGQTFDSFVTARILAPIGEYAEGAFSANLQLSSLLNEGLQPVLTSLKGNGSFRSSSVMLENTPSLTSLADQLQMDQFREVSLKDILLSFTFSDGKVELPPFDMQLGEVKASVTGMTYFDQRISYVMNMEIPRSLFGDKANEVLYDLVARVGEAGVELAPGGHIPLDVVIGGTFKRPEVSLSMASVREGLEQLLQREADRLLQEAETRIRDEVDDARETVEGEIQERVDDTREEVQEELEARASQIMAEAQRQADALRAQAQLAADAVREESEQQASRLQQEASGQGPLAQAAARQAAQQLVREADRRAVQLEAEAERNVQKLLDEASQQADKVRRGEDE